MPTECFSHHSANLTQARHANVTHQDLQATTDSNHATHCPAAIYDHLPSGCTSHIREPEEYTKYVLEQTAASDIYTDRPWQELHFFVMSALSSKHHRRVNRRKNRIKLERKSTRSTAPRPRWTTVLVLTLWMLAVGGLVEPQAVTNPGFCMLWLSRVAMPWMFQTIKGSSKRPLLRHGAMATSLKQTSYVVCIRCTRHRLPQRNHLLLCVKAVLSLIMTGLWAVMLLHNTSALATSIPCAQLLPSCTVPASVACLVVVPWLLCAGGDVEKNPGPQTLTLNIATAHSEDASFVTFTPSAVTFNGDDQKAVLDALDASQVWVLKQDGWKEVKSLDMLLGAGAEPRIKRILRAAPLGAGGAKESPTKAVKRAQLQQIKKWAEEMYRVSLSLHPTTDQQQGTGPDQQQGTASQEARGFIKIPFTKPLPLTLKSSFFNRKVYDTFLKRIIELDSEPPSSMWALIIAGDPGIGKSTFATRIFLWLAAGKKKFIYQYLKDGQEIQVYFDFSDPRDIKVDMALKDPADLDRFAIRYADQAHMKLIDGLVPDVEFSGNIRTIVMTSPDASKWSKFSKPSHFSFEVDVYVLEMWMPAWDVGELICAALKLGIIASLEEKAKIISRFNAFGGIARRVLGDRRRSVPDILKWLESSLSGDSAKRLVKSGHDGSQASLRHSFLRALISEDFKHRGWELATGPIAEIVHRKLNFLQWDELAALLKDLIETAMAATMLGQLFEQRAHVLGMQSLPKALGCEAEPSHVRYLVRAQAHTLPPPAVSAATALQGRRKRSRTIPTTSSKSVVIDLGSQEQQQACKDIANAFNTPHQQQLDYGIEFFVGMYLQPTHGQQGAWDALIWDAVAGFLILQYTYNLKHDLKLQYIQELLERIHMADPNGKYPVRLVFGVPQYPEEVFEHFTARHFSHNNSQGRYTSLEWEEVPQYVLDIPMFVMMLPMSAPKYHAQALDGAEKAAADRWRIMTICTMTGPELKEQLQQKNPPLRTSGTNKVLMHRLLEAEGLLPSRVVVMDSHALDDFVVDDDAE